MNSADRLRRLDAAYDGRLLKSVIAFALATLFLVAAIEIWRTNYFAAVCLLATVVIGPIVSVIVRRRRSRPTRT
jgi:hypothetical protein